MLQPSSSPDTFASFGGSKQSQNKSKNTYIELINNTENQAPLHTHHIKLLLRVLVLAGIELIFFIVASMGLCFGFVLETVLIIQGYFSYC